MRAAFPSLYGPLMADELVFQSVCEIVETSYHLAKTPHYILMGVSRSTKEQFSGIRIDSLELAPVVEAACSLIWDKGHKLDESFILARPAAQRLEFKLHSFHEAFERVLAELNDRSLNASSTGQLKPLVENAMRRNNFSALMSELEVEYEQGYTLIRKEAYRATYRTAVPSLREYATSLLASDPGNMKVQETAIAYLQVACVFEQFSVSFE